MNAYVEVEISDAPLADDVSTAPRAHSSNAIWFLAGAPIAAFLAQLFATDPYYTPLTNLCASSLAALTAFALVRCVVTRPQRFPGLELALFLQYASFGLAASLGPLPIGVTDYLPRAESYETASILGLASAVAIIAGHSFALLLPKRSGRAWYRPQLTPEVLEAGSAIYVPFAAVFVFLLTFFPSIRYQIAIIYAPATMLFGPIALTTVATVAYVLRPSMRTLVLLALGLALAGAAMLTTSMLSSAVEPMAALACVWWRIRSRVPVALVLGVAALILVIQPVKSYYRDIRWSDQNESVGTIDAWNQAFSNAAADRRRSSSIDATRERFSDLAALAYVTEFVPRSLPYAGSDVYEQTLIGMVPRVVWPEKPNMTKEGLDRYTIALGLMSEEGAEHSTTGIHLATQGYMSHGLFGGIVWCALFGLTLGLLHRLFGQGVAGLIASASLLIAWVPNLSVGFVGCFGTLWQGVLLVLLLPWLLWILGTLSVARRRSGRTMRGWRPGES